MSSPPSGTLWLTLWLWLILNQETVFCWLLLLNQINVSWARFFNKLLAEILPSLSFYNSGIDCFKIHRHIYLHPVIEFQSLLLCFTGRCKKKTTIVNVSNDLVRPQTKDWSLFLACLISAQHLRLLVQTSYNRLEPGIRVKRTALNNCPLDILKHFVKYFMNKVWSFFVRFLFVHFNSLLRVKLIMGVPLGSVLGPVLFTYYL